MIEQDLNIYSRAGLEDRTVNELEDIADAQEITHTDMVKAELVDAILLEQSDRLAQLIIANAVVQDQNLAVVVAQHEDKLRAIELRVQGLDDRTRPATQIMGSH